MGWLESGHTIQPAAREAPCRPPALWTMQIAQLGLRRPASFIEQDTLREGRVL
jgi:hypothetical protein